MNPTFPDFPSCRLFIDGYGSAAVVAENPEKMQELLQEANGQFFQGRGKIQVIPIPSDDGSHCDEIGIILAPGEHFICRTFSRRGVFFADLSVNHAFNSIPNSASVKRLVESTLQPQRVVFCAQEATNVDFIKHLVLHISKISVAAANRVIDEIISTAGIAEAHERIELTSSGDILQPLTKAHIAYHDGYLDVFSYESPLAKIVLPILHQLGITVLHCAEIRRGTFLRNGSF